MIVSAIVSVYNAERFLHGCLDDLLQQTIARDVEIIVVDAASPQREAEIVREYGGVRYLRAPRREPLYASWNRGIRAASGTYVTTANADDRHRRDALERLVGALERDRDAALAYADVAVTMRENATFDGTRPAVVCRWPDFDRRRLFRAAYVGPQPLWRRALHERYGWFDESLTAAGDYELWLRLAAGGERFVHVAEPLGLYLASPSSIEHRNAALVWRESEAARERHWRAEWGKRPRPRGFFLRPDLRLIASRLLRGDLAPMREAVAHARMLVHGRFGRNG